ncbi:MAG: hypothetical protein AAGG68_27935, partial [Bacteroidota bacterium]
VGLKKLHQRKECIFYHFPIIESLLPSLHSSKKVRIFIPRIESRRGLMKQKVYDLTIETIISCKQCLLKCKVEDLTEFYFKKAKIQQRIQEEMIATQTKD